MHHDLYALFQTHALPAELDPGQDQTLAALVYPTDVLPPGLGAGRIDLTGAVVDTDLPPHIRQQAQQEVERWRPHQAVRGESRSLGAAALLLTLAAAFPQTYLFLSAIQLLSNIISRTGEVTLVTDGERR